MTAIDIEIDRSQLVRTLYTQNIYSDMTRAYIV